MKKNRSIISNYSKVLTPLLDALGWRGSEIDLAESLTYNPEKMNELEFIETMANLRYETQQVKSTRQLKNKEFYPYLCITKNKEIFCVIKKEEDKYFVYDPQKNEYSLTEKIPSIKRILLFIPITKFSENLYKPQKNWFEKLILRFKKELATATLLSFFIALFSFSTPLFIMLIYSQINIASDYKILVYLGIATLIFIISQAGFSYLRQYLLCYLSSRIEYVLNTEVIRRILYLAPKYTETASVEAQVSRINDFENIKDFFSGSAFKTLLDLPFTILMLAGLIVVGGKIAYIPFAGMVIFSVALIFTFKIVKKELDLLTIARSEKNQIQSEIFKNFDHIQYIGKTNSWKRRYQQHSAKAAFESFREAKIISTINVFSQTIVNILLLITIAVSVKMVIDQNLSPGALFASFVITSRILSPLKRGFYVFSQISSFKRSIDQLNRFMNIPQETKPETIQSIHRQIDGGISFKSIYLRYNPDYQPALYNINFKMEKGEMLAITGHEGSGTSSILKLILRLYSPQNGSITIENINIKQIDPILLRKSISYMPEERIFFNETLFFNLRMAKPSASLKEIKPILKKVGLLEAVESLPSRLYTNINDEVLLVEDEDFYKKLKLAMLLLRKTKLYLIDKIKDHEVDENFISIIDELKTSASVIVITNSEKLIKKSQKVLQLDNARVNFFGEPEEYMSYIEGDK
ncbi:MAG: ATP-binding cassette domain-containing protein [Spirochaetales bacterium]|nr:ATP-binding cassette domain-containing protein [Spirochaetales bacterium]